MIRDTSPMGNKERKRYDETLAWLRRHRAWMAHAVGRLGMPSFCRRIRTAAVAADGDGVRLLFNPEFFAGLRLAALAGVLVHEALHLVFNHLARGAAMADLTDRRLFDLGCEAVINDAIARYYPVFKLPGEPVRGMALVGRDASGMSAEQVAALLREQLHANGTKRLVLLGAAPLDDHGVWGERVKAGWTQLSLSDGQIPEELDAEILRLSLKDAIGREALGKLRSSRRAKVRTNLRQFLRDDIRPLSQGEAQWQRPNRKAIGDYPRIILPTWAERDSTRRVLLAIDASASIPSSFIADALAVLGEGIEDCAMEAISFDAEAYPIDPRHPMVRGGGGTRVQAAEEHAGSLDDYPDEVICFTDGYTLRPRLRHPERWLWVLPPWGWTGSIPKGSRIVLFEG